MQLTHSFTRCRFGVAVRAITPPVGIYARNWGAALHDAAEGVHRPLMASAALFAPLEAGAPLALVALDAGWFQYAPDERALRARIAQRTGLAEAALLLSLSHTHAGANLNTRLADRPGGALIAPYLDQLADTIADALDAARVTLAPAWLCYGYGRCALATNRDLWDEQAARWVCGFNPAAPADDTLLVARVCDDAGATRATLFNYACHPTTLAWQNRLLSPDFVGAARAVLEQAFGAPALFLQGASGELAPREQYTGDTAVADRNGRVLGHAAAAAIEALPDPGTRFVYTGMQPSGANLGRWAAQPCDAGTLEAATQLQARLTTVELPLKPAPTPVVGRAQAAADAPEEREKALRRSFIAAALGDASAHQMPLWLWRLGDAALVAVPNEPYSLLQRELRRQLGPTRPLLVLGVTNGSLGYLAPQASYGQGLYQEQQSPYAPGCLERTITAAAAGLAELFAPGTDFNV